MNTWLWPSFTLVGASSLFFGASKRRVNEGFGQGAMRERRIAGFGPGGVGVRSGFAWARSGVLCLDMKSAWLF